MPRKRKPKTIYIQGRRWFQKTYGNTYHSVSVYLDGEHAHRMPYAYGYGDQYLTTAEDWLQANGYMPDREMYKHGGGESLRRYSQRKGIMFASHVSDVARKRDL